MAIRNALATTFLKLAKSLKTSNHVFDDDLLYKIHSGQNEGADRESQANLLNAYRNVLWVFCGVNTIATNAAMVPLKIYRETRGGDREYIDDHPLQELLDDPNRILTRFELLVRTFAFLELAGNSYWFLEKPIRPVDEKLFGSNPIKIHVERPDLVEVVSLDKSERLSYKRNVNDKTIDVSMDNVVHFTHFNPFSTYTGLPTITAGQDSLIMELYLSTFGKSFFKNSVVPSMVFSTDLELSDAAFERFKILIERQYKGADKAHQLLLLGGGLQPLDIKIPSPTDSDFVQSSDLVRDKALMNMGCYHLVSLARGSTNTESAYKMFWQDTMMPRLKNVEQTLTKVLLANESGSKLHFEFDTRGIAGLREDFMEESLGYFRFIQSGIMTPNEVRNKMGLQGDVEGGDIPGLGHQPSVARFSSNEERASIEESFNNIEEKSLNRKIHSI